jgi:hypothetical protein
MSLLRNMTENLSRGYDDLQNMTGTRGDLIIMIANLI